MADDQPPNAIAIDPAMADSYRTETRDMTAKAINWRGGVWRAFRDSMTRDELFAGLFVLGCANGLAGDMITATKQLGLSAAFFHTFQVSAIVWISCFVGVWLALRDKRGQIQSLDLGLGAVMVIIVALPFGKLSWLTVTALSLYILLFTAPHPARRRGAVILLATSIPMFWSKLTLQFFATFILTIDATLIASLLGTERVGNMVRFADNSGYLVIYPACSSLANMSLAFLCWVTIAQLVRHRWSPKDLIWLSLLCASVIAVNVTRISIMGLSSWHYLKIHNQFADMVTNELILIVAAGICVLGVRRELFSRA
jgi:hypothetical protein